MAVKASFEIRGLDKFLRNLKYLAPQALNAADRSVLNQLETVATEAKKITPVDTGTLRGTIHARKGRVTARKIEHMAVAGPMPSDGIDTGPANEYAIYVHENTGAKHTVGEAKFLEKALDGQARKAGRAISDDIRKALKF